MNPPGKEAVFAGKSALITGGGTGIGRAIAEALVERGARVLVCGRRETPLRGLAESSDGQIIYCTMDVVNAADRATALETARSEFGRLDMLVNNAAYSLTLPFAEQNAQQISQAVDTNLTAPMLLIHEALPLLGEGSSILNVSSAGARYQAMPSYHVTPYSVAKAGLNQLTRILATDLGPSGIRVNAVSPGLTDTEMSAGAFEQPEFLAEIAAMTALGRVGQPEDIVPTALFLLSEEAAWVTGQVVDATGGLWLSN